MSKKEAKEQDKKETKKQSPKTVIEQSKKQAKEKAKKPIRRKVKTLQAASPPTSMVIGEANNIEIEGVEATSAEFFPYDENLLERSRIQWQLGDWVNLAKLERASLQHHPDRAKLALLAAASHQQLGNMSAARQFICLAKEWGCNKTLVSQILISGVHNTLARATAISGSQQSSIQHLKKSILIVNPSKDISLLLKARTLTQLESLPFIASDTKHPLNHTKDNTLYSPTQKVTQKKDPKNTTDIFLYNLINPKRLTEVVDIGANPIDGDPPYKPMLDAQLCKLTGFEPQQEALKKLLTNKKKHENYFPYAIGDGEQHTLNISRASGMTSLFSPNPETLNVFKFFKPLSEAKNKINIKTHKLDDIKEIHQIDFLKIDIQGGELDVFKSGKNKLSKTVVIQTEISFLPLYKNQPTFGEIDTELRNMGFIPHCFAAIKKWPLGDYIIDNDPKKPANQLLEADIVYIRDITKPESLTNEQLEHLALISHYCYASYDLTFLCLQTLENRDSIYLGMCQKYLENS